MDSSTDDFSPNPTVDYVCGQTSTEKSLLYPIANELLKIILHRSFLVHAIVDEYYYCRQKLVDRLHYIRSRLPWMSFCGQKSIGRLHCMRLWMSFCRQSFTNKFSLDPTMDVLAAKVSLDDQL